MLTKWRRTARPLTDTSTILTLKTSFKTAMQQTARSIGFQVARAEQRRFLKPTRGVRFAMLFAQELAAALICLTIQARIPAEQEKFASLLAIRMCTIFGARRAARELGSCLIRTPQAAQVFKPSALRQDGRMWLRSSRFRRPEPSSTQPDCL